MSEKQCAVCGKTVADTDQEAHLRSQHLGPHYFWFGVIKYRTEEPSMRVSDIRKLANGSTHGHVVEDRDGKWIYYGDDEAVDLTRCPHLSTRACSECGALSGPKGIADLGIREWTCSDCGSAHSRDVNAARNILGRERPPLAAGIALIGETLRARHHDLASPPLSAEER